jgi:hypothetical protein
MKEAADVYIILFLCSCAVTIDKFLRNGISQTMLGLKKKTPFQPNIFVGIKTSMSKIQQNFIAVREERFI